MIDTSTWKAFGVSDFFEVLKGRNKLSNTDIDEGDTPVYSSNSSNGGIFGYTSKEPDYVIDEDTPFYITFGDHTKAINIAEQSFCVMDNVKVLTSKIRSHNILRFIMTSWMRNVPNLGYSRHWSETEKADIWLPVTSDGQPDWDYMESYMKAVMEESEKSLENLRKADNTKHLIDVSGWGEFRVGDLFEKLDLKCHKKFNKATDVSTEQTEEFDLPLVNAKHSNNGIMYYGRSKDWDSAEMTIDIVGDGAASTGDVYAQPQRTGVLYNAYLVKPLWDCTSEYVLQFMACVIERCVKSHFGYENKCTWDKVSQEFIWLPVTSTGEPDWQYMEDYMKQIMDKSEQIISDLQKVM